MTIFYIDQNGNYYIDQNGKYYIEKEISNFLDYKTYIYKNTHLVFIKLVLIKE